MTAERLTRAKIILLAVTTAVGYTTWGLLISLQPPFYPLEAENKGATPRQYGFVFGIFNLCAFLTAPIFGKYGPKLGPTNLYRFGAFIQAVCGIGFGFLKFIDDLPSFLALSYILRALSGIADAASWSSVLSILMKLFPSKVARIMAWTETFFGLGFMIGPALGSLLYGVGGFGLPFFTVGGLAFCVATAMIFVIPKVDHLEGPVDSNGHAGDDKIDDNSNGFVGNGTSPLRKTPAGAISYRKVFACPTLLLPFCDALVCFLGNGLIESMLQPYAVKNGATVGQVGVIFLALGGTYMVFSPVSGWVCDKVAYPAWVALLGNIFSIVAFTFLAPLPFVPTQTAVWAMTVCTATQGVGIALTNVSSFTRAQMAAQRIGFNQDLKTYIMISGLFASSLFLGNFLGPTLAGFLVANMDFTRASMVFWAFYILIASLNSLDLFYQIRKGYSNTRLREGYESID